MPVYLATGTPAVLHDIVAGTGPVLPPAPTTVGGAAVVHALASVSSPRDSLQWGTYKPDASTTGVYPGSTMTVVNGDHTPASNGVYTNLDIYGIIRTAGKTNTTYRNCILRGPASLPGGAQGLMSAIAAHGRGHRLIDCTFLPQFPNFRNVGAHGYGYELLRCDASLLVDMAEVFCSLNGPGGAADNSLRDGPADVLIQECYFHDHAFFGPGVGGETSADGSHADGVQWEGCTGLIVRGNNFTGKLAAGYGPGLGGGSNQNANSSMQVAPDVGNIGGGVITKNWFGGGGVSINIADKPAKNRFIADAGAYTYNRFGRTSFYYPSIFKISTGTGHSTAIDTTGNVFDDNNAPLTGANIVRVTI